MHKMLCIAKSQCCSDCIAEEWLTCLSTAGRLTQTMHTCKLNIEWQAKRTEDENEEDAFKFVDTMLCRGGHH